MKRTRVLCDGCGVRILVPVEDKDDVNYCQDCMPTKEEYDPRGEERRIDPKTDRR